MGKTTSSSRVWMILAFIFIAISIALSAYLIWKKVKDDDSSSGRPSEDEILARFRAYFRTVAQQQAVARSYEKAIVSANKTQAPTDRNYPPENCTFTCSKSNQAINRVARSVAQLVLGYEQLDNQLDKGQGRQVYVERSKRNAQSSTVVRHACCIATLGFTDPEQATNLEGKEVSVVQFQTMRQYFPHENCRQAKGCNGCSCGNQPSFTTAVVWVGDDVTLDIIVLKGCCKCFNT